MVEFEQLIALFGGKKVYIHTGNTPTADGCAAAFGLQRLMKEFGISARVCCSGLQWDAATDRLLRQCGVCIAELPSGAEPEKGAILITDGAGDRASLSCRSALSAEVAGFYSRTGMTPDKSTASALVCGIKEATRNFTANVTEADADMFAYMFKLCDRKIVEDFDR